MQSAYRHATTPGRHFPLHVHVGTLAIVLIILTGGIIGWYNYAQSSRIILASANRVFDDLTREVATDFANGSRLNHTTIEMLARSGLGAARSTADRLKLLPLLQASLSHNDRLYSVYAGYDDGAFFQLVPLRTEARRASFKAPDNAAYLAWSVEASESGAGSTYRFFDTDLNLVAERPYDGRPYDPRTRPWFSAACSSVSFDPTRSSTPSGAIRAACEVGFLPNKLDNMVGLRSRFFAGLRPRAARPGPGRACPISGLRRAPARARPVSHTSGPTR